MPSFPSELARAWRRYFNENAAANVVQDVVTVIQAEDLTKGPYPPSRVWASRLEQQAAVAAQFSYGIIHHLGPDDSVVVIDKIFYRLLAAANLKFGALTYTALSFGSSGSVYDRNPEKEPPGGSILGEILMGDISSGVTSNASAFGLSSIPVQDTVLHELEGPWFLASGTQFVVRPDAVNIGLHCAFFGRFYVIG